MIFYGYERHATVLGTKLEQCTACGVTGQHQLVRKSWWATLFWIPLVFLRFMHGMICQNCGAWTGIPWLTMRRGLRAGRLPLSGRNRTGVLELRDAAADETGRRPSEADLFDTVTRNPKPGGADFGLKVWIAGVVILLGLGGVAVAATPKPTAGPAAPRAHTCYEDASGYLNGCRNLDGSVVGSRVGNEVTCYFAEPLPTGEWSLYCPGATVAP